MLDGQGQAGQRSLLADVALPQRSGATMKASDMGASGAGAEVITPIATWLRDGLREYAEKEMPEASWDEVIQRALAVGLGALNGVVSARRPNDRPPASEPAYPFDRKHIPAFKALCAAVEGGPLTLDSVAVEAITGRMGSASLRGIGTFLAGLARKSPVMGLRVEALGRKPGRVTMDYRLSREGSTG